MDFESELVRLVEPIAADNACGASLDATQTLAALDAYQIFGRLTPAKIEPDWRALRTSCIAALETSKDLRVLAHLTAAVIRVGVLTDTLRILPLAANWLERYWDEVHPRIDDDAIMRRNALSFFADRVGIVDALRRTPIVTVPQLGSFCLRDFDIATGVVPKSGADTKVVSATEINAALSVADPDLMARVCELAAAAANAMQTVEATMLARGGGSGAVPKLDVLVQTLRRIRQMLGKHVPPPLEPASDVTEVAVESVAKAPEVGAITSREDVLRALDAVLGYYRSAEPGSLVPVMAERVKRLVSMSFLEALAEIAPETLKAVKTATGVRE